jgi:hypothetical protein
MLPGRQGAALKFVELCARSILGSSAILVSSLLL